MIYETDSKYKSRLVITTGRDLHNKNKKAKNSFFFFPLSPPFLILGEMMFHKGSYL